MSRWTDADALMQDINNSIEAMTAIGFTVDAEYLWGKLHDALEHAPSIDIVRCGGCKYDGTWKCPWRNTQVPRYPSADDFCSYGEREGE